MTDYGSITVRNPGPILRATVPLPPGMKWKDSGCPLAVKSSNGVTYPAQWERVVSLDGDVRVAELLAYVGDDASQHYEVVRGPHRDSRCVPGNWAASWSDLPPAFSFTLSNGTVATVQTSYDPIPFRSGPVAQTRRFHTNNITGWSTVYHGLDIVEIDLIVHNGEPNSEPWFFRELRIENAPRMQYAWPEVNSGPDGELLKPRADGKCWFLVARAQRHFRFIVHNGTVRSSVDSSRMIYGDGWGTSDAWKVQPMWLPMQLPLPDLPMYDARMRQECKDQWIANTQALIAGTTIGVGQKLGRPGGRVGCFNVWGSPYGGVTGGSDRELAHTLGICGALTSEPSAFLALQSELAMTVWRTPLAIVDPMTGSPIDSSGYTGWAVSATDGRFSQGNKKDGTFGFYAARMPTVPATEYDATEFAKLDQYNTHPVAGVSAFSPHDWQHFVRAWSPAVALALLRNDPIALWTLRMWSEVWCMSQDTDGNLRGEYAAVEANPACGSMWGRAQGHGYAMLGATCHMTHSTRLRERHAQFTLDAVETVFSAQMSNGFVRAHPAISKDGPMFFAADGVTPIHAVTTPDEEVYISLAARSCNDTKWMTDFADYVTSLSTAIWSFAWDHGNAGGSLPDKVAVRPVPRNSEPYTVCPARNNFDSAEVSLVFAWVLYHGWATVETQAAIARIAGSATYAGALAALTGRAWNKLVIDDNVFLIAALQKEVKP